MEKLLVALSLSLACAAPAVAQCLPPGGMPGFAGTVRAIRVESAIRPRQGGRPAEGPRRLDATLFYDAARGVFERTDFGRDGEVTSKLVEKYDPDRCRIEMARYNGGGELIYRAVSVYGDRKRMSEELKYAGDGTLISRMVLDRSDLGKVVGGTYFNPDGSVQQRFVYLDLPQDNKFESQVFDRDGALTNRMVMTRDGRGGEELLEYEAGNILYQRSICKRDKQGFLLDEASYDGNGVLRRKATFEWEFDAYGNWVKQVKVEWDPGRGEIGLETASYQDITYDR